MPPIKFVIPVLFFCSFLFSGNTTVEEMDLTKGLWNLHLGDTITKFKGKLIEQTSCDDKLNCTYEYTGKEAKSLFGVPVRVTMLVFHKGRLNSINPNFGSSSEPFTKYQYAAIQRGIEDQLGKGNRRKSGWHQKSPGMHTFRLKGYDWRESKTWVSFVRNYYYNKAWRMKTGYLSVYAVTPG